MINKTFLAGFPGKSGLLLTGLIIISLAVCAQYDSTKIRQDVNSYGFNWKNGDFKNSLGIPLDTIKMAVADSGSIAYKNGGAYVWTGYYWKNAGGTSGWGLTGNAGTSAGTNFIGTTDNVGLMFKTNNVQSGYLDVYYGNTSFGEGSATSITIGSQNVAIGYNALNSNVTGSGNTAVGASALGGVLGSYNTAIGEGALSNVTGINNIAIGRNSAKYFTNDSNHLIINSLDRTNKLGDTTASIIYGYQDATAANQRLYLNSNVYLPYAASGAGTKALRINPGTGLITYADTTTSSGGTVTSVSGTSNQITSTGGTTPVLALASGGTLPGAWALGTPASGTVTNLTGTASININGTVGATTPSTGAFTTGSFSGQVTNTTNGAASTPASRLTGTWFTGGTATTTKPQLLIEPTGTTSTAWSTNGTGLGINAASGFGGYLLDAQVAGVTKFYVTSSGQGVFTNFVNGSYFRNSSNNFHLYGANTGTGSIGALTLFDGGETGAAAFQMGGTTTANPALIRNGTGIDVKLADNSAMTGLQSLYDRFGSGTPEGAVTAPVGAVFHRTDGGAGTSFYVKESGSGNTGWVAK